MEKHSVTIERKHMPLRQVLAQKEVAAELLRRDIKPDRPEILRLSRSGRTFSQYLCLSETGDLPDTLLAAVNESLEAADAASPVFLEEQYPWLKEPSWTVDMGDVSYYKVTAQLGAGQFVNIRRVRCEQEGVSPGRTAGRADSEGMFQAVLWLYAEENVEFPGGKALSRNGGLRFAASICLDGGALKIVVNRREVLQLMVKELLLRGNLDLSK